MESSVLLFLAVCAGVLQVCREAKISVSNFCVCFVFVHRSVHAMKTAIPASDRRRNVLARSTRCECLTNVAAAAAREVATTQSNGNMRGVTST